MKALEGRDLIGPRARRDLEHPTVVLKFCCGDHGSKFVGPSAAPFTSWENSYWVAQPGRGSLPGPLHNSQDRVVSRGKPER